MELPKHVDIQERMPKKNDQSVESLRKMIRSLHLKVTDQRLLILKTLHQADAGHMTAHEVFEKIRKIDGSLGFATVYRFLRRLTEAGFVTEVRMGGLPARYEMTPASHHDHLTCTHCGKIQEFANDEIEQLQLKVAEKHGFILTNHVLELYGVCPDCQRREARLVSSKN